MHHRRGAAPGRIRASATQRNTTSAVSALTATQAAAVAPPPGTKMSAEDDHEHEGEPVGEGHRTLCAARDQPELQDLAEEDRNQRQRLNSQNRDGIDVLVSADEEDSGPREDPDTDHEERSDQERRFGHALQPFAQPLVVLVTSDGEKWQRDREDQCREAKEQLEDAEGGAENACLLFGREKRDQHDQHTKVDDAHCECDSERQCLSDQSYEDITANTAHHAGTRVRQYEGDGDQHDADDRLHPEEREQAALGEDERCNTGEGQQVPKHL